MPAKDIYHDTVKHALIKDGWTITKDPLILSIGKKDLFVDLGAEKLIAATKENREIAVEIKSFIGISQVNDLEKALGQYTLYYQILLEKEDSRTLYIAIPKLAYEEIFTEPIGAILIKRKILN
ncbi:MAG: element excision factor XisH family protein [Spirulina sp.]